MPVSAESSPCPHCGGPLEPLGKNRQQQPILRCRSCGREPGEIVRAPKPATVTAAGATPTGRPCAVGGCPGVLFPSGACGCCDRRARWSEANMPKRECEICGGQISGRANMKYCLACKPIAQRAQIANAGNAKSARKTSPTAH